MYAIVPLNIKHFKFFYSKDKRCENLHNNQILAVVLLGN